MTVTGDTKSLELADLLQNFETHQRTCTLTLTTESGRAHLYLREGKISALAADGRAELADVLAGWKLISQRALDDARRKKGRSKRSLIDLLLQAGAISEEKLRAAAEAALVDDVTNLVAAGTKSFEFSGEEGPLDAFDPDELELNLGIPVSATLLEAARRTDHWVEIRKTIPSESVTFIARDHVVPPPDLENADLAALLLAALNGTRTAKEATDLFPRGRLQAYECLARFVRDRLVRVATAEDLLTIAASLETSSPQRARRLAARGLEAEPHHLKLLALEARLARRLGEPKAAAAALKVVAHVHFEAGDTVRSRQALDEARTLHPTDAPIRERILALDLEEGRFAEAVRDGMQLVALYRKPGLHDKAKEVLKRLVDADPISLEIRLELARAQVDSGEPEQAVEGLLHHGKKLISREEYDAARAVYREVLKISSGHKDARRALESIDQEIYKRRRERRRQLRRFVLASAAVLALGAMMTREIAARVDCVKTTSLVAREELIEHRKYAEAIRAFEDLASRHAFTVTVLYDVRSRIADLEAKLPPAPPARPVPAKAAPGKDGAGKTPSGGK